MIDIAPDIEPLLDIRQLKKEMTIKARKEEGGRHYRADVIDLTIMEKDDGRESIKVHWWGTKPKDDKWVRLEDCRFIRQFDVKWEDIKAKLPLAQDPESRATRKKVFEAWNTTGKKAALNRKELEEGVRTLLAGDIGQDVEEASKAVMCAWKLSRNIAPSHKSAGAKHVTPKEFHAFVVAFRCYLELAELYEHLDATQRDDQKLSLRECQKGVAQLAKWGVHEADLHDKFKVDMNSIDVGDWVVVTSDENVLNKSFERIAIDKQTLDIYRWNPAMTGILGKTHQVVALQNDNTIIGLKEPVENSGQPVWYYSAKIVEKALDPFVAKWKFEDFAKYCIEHRWSTIQLELELDSDDEEVLVEEATAEMREACRLTNKKRQEGIESRDNRQNVMSIFKKWDVDYSGKISEDELAKALTELNPDISPEIAKKVVSLADANSDGEIDYEEFCLWVFAPTMDDDIVRSYQLM